MPERLRKLEKAAAERERLMASLKDEWVQSDERTDEDFDALLLAMHWLFWGVSKPLWERLPDSIREAYERDDKAAIRASQAPDIETWVEGYAMPDGGRIVPLLVPELDQFVLHRFPCVCDPERVILPPEGEASEESA